MGVVQATLANWLLPTRCCHCRRRATATGPLCDACAVELEALGACRSPASCAVPAWSAYAYEGPARSLVHAFKYRGGAALADELAAAILLRVPATVWHGAVVVAVPSHPGNAARRGYSPSELLARAVSRRLGMPLCHLLARAAGHAPQSAAGRRARRRMPADSYRLLAPIGPGVREIAQLPTNVVMLDDVRTTGVTLDVCASQLRGLFTGEIRAATFASAQLC